tara:strand:+ start:14123 stop:14557 length:435 start_codon:yes stop_codon:yes gene_type:complete
MMKSSAKISYFACKNTPTKLMSDKVALSDAIATIAVNGAKEKKARSLVKIDLRNLDVAVSDFFIICHGDSNTQVKAIADSVEKELKESIDEKPFSREGGENGQWVVLDYLNVVVHIFLKESREFYGLETLWGDGDLTQYPDHNQ